MVKRHLPPAMEPEPLGRRLPDKPFKASMVGLDDVLNSHIVRIWRIDVNGMKIPFPPRHVPSSLSGFVFFSVRPAPQLRQKAADHGSPEKHEDGGEGDLLS